MENDMRKTFLGAACALATTAAFAAQAPTATSGIDRANLDPAVRAQDDLFRHVNGKWLATFEIPVDKSNYGSFTRLSDQAEADLRKIIEELAASEHKKGSVEQKVGDMYASFMDEAAVEKAGAKPLADTLKRIERIKDKDGLVETMALLGKQGVRGAWGAAIFPDQKKSDEYGFYLGQSGLGLPDRDYYLDPKFKDKLDAYGPHIERMLTLAGTKDAAAKSKAIVALETRLAQSSWTRVERRDREKNYNKMTRAELAKLAPGIDFDRAFEAIGADGVEKMIVGQPTFFPALAKAMDEVPLADWKAWLSWNAIDRAAPVLSKAFVDESFAFRGTVLSGTPENRPRWKRGVAMVEGALGEAVGKVYVERHFPPAAKQRMDGLVKNLVEAYRQSIDGLDWMSADTKVKAQAKLAKFTPKIGYPTKWRDYSKLEVKRGDAFGNALRAAGFEFQRNLDKLGKPIDRTEWFMTPQTVNAYYNPTMNEIVFPAAILQPPFFDLAADDAANYGGIGAVIGHEIGHGFDDQGSKSDGDGNLVNWWTDADRKEFEARAAKLIAQYDAFEALPGHKVKGALTVGENIGDLGGLAIAYKAWKLSLDGREAPVIDGLTGDQRFFYGWAQVWARKYRDAELINRLSTDSHAPSEFRANIVRNLPAFQQAFGVKPGDKLYFAPEQQVRIW
jgi:putative endopeptidase